jgi:hypothetical protein
MTPGTAAIVAQAVVVGRPTWSPAVIAALARMFQQYQSTPALPECTPGDKDQESPHAN